MAKLKKFPKMPRAGASLETLQNAKKKFMEVKKHNDAIKREKTQRANARKALTNMKK